MAYDRCQSYQSSPSCGRSKRRKSGNEPHKRGLNTKLHLAVDANGMPVRFTLTEGTAADCKQAIALIEGFIAEYLLADKAYDFNELIEYALNHGIELVIPPKKNRINERDYDKYLYKLRHLIENAFLHLKRWRGIATRYAKNIKSFAAAIQIRIIALWANIS